MSFNSYQGVVQVAPDGCGAYALSAALTHVIGPQIINRLNTGNLGLGYSDPDPIGFAERVYQTTGNLLLNPPHATYRYQVPVADRNSPSAMMYMAVRHGVVPANLRTSYDNAALATFSNIQVTNAGAGADLLTTEVNLISPPQFGNVNGPLNYMVLPVAGEAHILLVNNNAHWVVINHNEIYDSATGFVGPYVVNNPLPLTTISYTMNPPGHQPQPVNLAFSGLWIRLA